MDSASTGPPSPNEGGSGAGGDSSFASTAGCRVGSSSPSRSALLGFADSQARKAAAVLRVAPLVGLLYSTLVVWFIEGAYASPLAAPPLRPWYPHKRGLSFADVL